MLARLAVLVDMHTKQFIAIFARLAQLVEHSLDVGRARGSSPLPRTMIHEEASMASELRYTTAVMR